MLLFCNFLVLIFFFLSFFSPIPFLLSGGLPSMGIDVSFADNPYSTFLLLFFSITSIFSSISVLPLAIKL